MRQYTTMNDITRGELLKQLREKVGLSQRKLAELSGVDRGRINQLEQGKRGTMSMTTANKLAPHLKVSSTIFLTGEITDEQQAATGNIGVEIPIAIPVYPEFRFHAPGGVEAPVDYVYLQKPKTAAKNISAFTIEGDCMEPLIHTGDYIVVDSDADINTGDTVACKCNEELHIGKLRRFDNELWLENKAGRVRLMDCQIVAKVIQITRKL